MQTAQQTPREPLGPQGEPCAECGAPLAADQRYCINCGRRRGEPRVAAEAPQAAPAPAAPPPSDAGRPNDVSPLGAVLGVALLGGMLLIGVLIGRGDSGDDQATTTFQVGEAPAATTTTTPNDSTAGEPESEPATTGSAIPSDWPAGTNGFTVQITTLPKSGATPETVDAARSGAEASGAEDVGVLDSDQYPSLTPGNYVIYSGVFDTRDEATSRLDELGSDVTGGTVVEVSEEASKGSGGSTDASGGTTPPLGENGD